MSSFCFAGNPTTEALQTTVETPTPPPETIPAPPIDPTKLQKAGVVGAAIVTTLFVGSWVARGVVERKTPTFFEVAFACTTAVTALADPKAVASLPLRFLERK